MPQRRKKPLFPLVKRSKPSSQKRQPLTRQIARRLYEIRLSQNIPGTADGDWQKATKIVKDPLRRFLFKANRPFVFLEKRVFEPILSHMNSLAVIQILSLAGAASILIGGFTYLSGEYDRREAKVYQAWQVITASQGQGGSGGRKEALEFLNSEPRRFPMFWRRWERQSLQGIEAPRAYLYRAKLDGANLSPSNFERASLQQASLRDVDLSGSNLRNTDMTGTCLQEASLYKSVLSQAILLGARMQEAYIVESVFDQADITSAYLENSRLAQSSFREVSLDRAFMQSSDILDSDFENASLVNARLMDAKLHDSNFKGANLAGANLNGADIQSTDFRGAYYTDETTPKSVCEKAGIMESPIFNISCKTEFPKNFDPAEYEMKLVKKLEDIPSRGDVPLSRIIAGETLHIGEEGFCQYNDESE